MKHLLDVNVLIAGVWKTHSRHAQAQSWLRAGELFVCPITELGFLRISSHPKAIGADMDAAREALGRFAAHWKVGRIPDDLPALASHPKKSGQVTDHYLADLAGRHGLKLATFDADLKHPSAVLI